MAARIETRVGMASATEIQKNSLRRGMAQVVELRRLQSAPEKRFRWAQNSVMATAARANAGAVPTCHMSRSPVSWPSLVTRSAERLVDATRSEERRVGKE